MATKSDAPWYMRLWRAMFGHPVQRELRDEIQRGQTERRRHAQTMVMYPTDRRSGHDRRANAG